MGGQMAETMALPIITRNRKCSFPKCGSAMTNVDKPESTRATPREGWEARVLKSQSSILQRAVTALRQAAFSDFGVVRPLSSPMRCLPDFLIIGSQRSGTTSLYDYICQHPDVIASQRKEVHFFDLNYQRGDWYYKASFPLKLKKTIGGLGRRQILTGEATPCYLIHPHVPLRLFDMLPSAKLITILRNPIDRAFSHYNACVRMGVEKLSFTDAIAAESRRIDTELDRMMVDPSYYSWVYRRFSYLTRSHYADHLETWLKHFPRDAFLIMDSEGFFKDPQQTLDRVFDFLGLSPYRIEDLEVMRWLDYNESLDPNLRRELIDYFEPHNERLFQLIGERFSWA